MINYIFLAISVSIDSLGIGIAYGIRNTQMFLLSKFILFTISILISSISILIGGLICSIIPSKFATYMGVFILIFLGLWIIYQSFKKDDDSVSKLPTPTVLNKKKNYNFIIKSLGITIKIIRDPISSDLDSSKKIDWKEALYLGIALSLDSIGVGIGGSIVGVNSISFPIFVSTFQLIFLSFGNFLGKKISAINLPKNIWSVISGTLLIIIGICKLFI